MKAMLFDRVAPLAESPDPLRLADIPSPNPGADQLLLSVRTCGVCHTELDEIEGRLTPPNLPLIPGHEVIGTVAAIGAEVTKFSVGDRVGVGWIHSSCGGNHENLSPEFRATGYHVHGGYAEQMTVPQDYAVAIPATLSDVEAAPLMCAGAIGYRALRLANLKDSEPLGLMGFGGSAHLVLQLARHLYPASTIHVFDRDPQVRAFAVGLGADSAGAIDQPAPLALRSVIDTTPAWLPVVEAMKNLAPGGRLVINAIRKEAQDQQALLGLRYHDHLWMEREIKSVANLTYRDIADFVPLAAEIPLHVETTVFPLSDANEALRQLRGGKMRGANVLRVSGA